MASQPPGPLPRLAEGVVTAGPAAQWRLLALLWAMGGAVAVVVGLVGAGPQADANAVIGVGATAIGAAVLIAGIADQLDPCLIGPVLVLGTASVSLATIAAGAADTPFVLFYAWVGAEAWYFLSYRGAIAYTAYGIVLSAAMTVALPTSGGTAVSWWLVTAASLIVIGAMAAALRIRSDRLIAQLRALADRDELTGVLNRRGFSTRVAAALARQRRTAEPVALVLADLDRFKEVNDRFGHQAGDDLLRRFAACCDSELRGSDALGRVGGEEFALLLPASDAEAAAAVAERIRERLARELSDPDGNRVTASFGVAACPIHAPDADGLLDAADSALYAAKRAGRDLVLQAGTVWPVVS